MRTLRRLKWNKMSNDEQWEMFKELSKRRGELLRRCYALADLSANDRLRDARYRLMTDIINELK